uniref:Molybdate-anion transporter n=1 Tax=Aegilops tauschii subsp. strangulata TaxID=200361 RepID=A0A453J3T6_AEGTS
RWRFSTTWCSGAWRRWWQAGAGQERQGPRRNPHRIQRLQEQLRPAGDWLQGPYMYYLYSQYGFDKGDIGRLFVAGFGSSMLFGTIVGSLADRQGRKRACITYCITYILSCITKHSPHYRVLLGRILGGVATSLLFSAFESWLVAEHNKRGYDPQWLSI